MKGWCIGPGQREFWVWASSGFRDQDEGAQGMRFRVLRSLSVNADTSKEDPKVTSYPKLVPVLPGPIN